MRQWEIYDFPFPDADNPHPCVITSPDEIAGNDAILDVHIFSCTSLRPSKKLKSNEVGLDVADGLDGPTIVKCQWMPIMPKALAGRLRGTVGLQRQRAIQMKFKEIFRCHAA